MSESSKRRASESRSDASASPDKGRLRARFTLPARRDLLELIEFLAERDPSVAEQTLVAMESSIRRLEQYPELGHRRSDLAADSELRFFPVRGYMIVYRSRDSELDVLRILHGRRNARAELGEGEA